MAASNRPLWQWSACDLAEAIAARRVTAVEAVGRAGDRMRATNGTTAAVGGGDGVGCGGARMRATNGRIMAVVADLGEAALREAEAHDKPVSAGGPIGPLHGVPVTIKENVDQKGCTTPNGR